MNNSTFHLELRTHQKWLPLFFAYYIQIAILDNPRILCNNMYPYPVRNLSHVERILLYISTKHQQFLKELFHLTAEFLPELGSGMKQIFHAFCHRGNGRWQVHNSWRWVDLEALPPPYLWVKARETFTHISQKGKNQKILLSQEENVTSSIFSQFSQPQSTRVFRFFRCFSFIMGFRVSNLDEFRIQESWVFGGPRDSGFESVLNMCWTVLRYDEDDLGGATPVFPRASDPFWGPRVSSTFSRTPHKKICNWYWVDLLNLKKMGGFNIFTPLFCLETSSQTYWSNKVCTCNIWQAQTAIFPTQSFWCIIEEFKKTTIIICLNIDLWQCEAEPHLSVFYASDISRSGASSLLKKNWTSFELEGSSLKIFLPSPLTQKSFFFLGGVTLRAYATATNCDLRCQSRRHDMIPLAIGYRGVSKIGVKPPKSSILIGFSL